MIPVVTSAATSPAEQVPSAQACQLASTGGGAGVGTTYQYQQTPTGSSTCTITTFTTDPSSGVTFQNSQIVQYDAQGTPLNVQDGINGVPTGPATKHVTVENPECSIINWSFQNCIWFPLMTWLGSWFLTIGGSLLLVAGGLFDVLVQHVVIGFGQTLIDLGIKGAIDTGWTIFRDVANIVIIGMFVFIALCTILGIQQYGAKKLAARVIIVAVLLNFSLLFTEMIVDFSNFTAYQFYSAAANQAAAAQSGAPGSNSSFDISAAFLKPMGIQSIWNTYSVADAAGKASGNSGFASFLYGLVGGLMLAGIAFVLAYGCFQIAARAVAIIFLMVTASIAFASYLVPQFSDGNYGWKAWWHELINVSVFAPLLMIFLFIALQILTATKNLIPQAGPNKDVFGISSLIGGSTGTASGAFGVQAWQAIFTYIIVIGLLYVSIKISSKLASSAGSGLVSGALNLAGAVATGGVGLVSRFAIAPAARQVIGGAAYGRAETKQKEGREAATRAADLQAAGYDDLARKERGEAARRGRQAKFASSIAESKMNVMDTSRAKRVAKRFKVSGVFSGQSAKGTVGYATAAKNAGGSGAKLAESLKPDIEKIRINAEKERLEANRHAYEQKEGAAKAARLAADAEKQSRDTAQKQQKEMEEKRNDALIAAARDSNIGKAADHSTAQNQAIATELRQAFEQELSKVDSSKRLTLETEVRGKNMHDSEALKELHKKVVDAISDPTTRETSNARLQQIEHDRSSALRQEGENIRSARERIVQAAMANDAIKADGNVAAAQQKLVGATADLNRAIGKFNQVDASAKRLEEETATFKANLQGGVKEAGNAAVKAVNETMPEIAAESVLQQRSRWKKMLGVETTFDERAASKARGAFKTRESGRRAKEAINDYLEERERQTSAPKMPPSNGAETH